MKSGKRNTKAVGQWGEQLAATYLERKGWVILDRNYWKKWGEVDLVVRETDKMLHFVEVKSVSYKTRAALEHAVTHETWRPEELVHQFKLHQIHKALETLISEHNYDGDWEITVVTVRFVPRETLAVVNLLKI